MELVGYERGVDKLLDGWVSLRYVTEIGQDYGWSITTGSNVEFKGPTGVITDYRVGSTTLTPLFPTEGQNLGTDDYDDLPEGYEYGSTSAICVLTLTRERTGGARWWDEYSPSGTIRWDVLPTGGTYLVAPFDTTTTPERTTNGKWLSIPTLTHGYDIPIGARAADTGESTVLDYEDSGIIESGLYVYTPNDWINWPSLTTHPGAYVVFSPWYLADIGTPYEFDVPRPNKLNAFSYRPFDGTWRVNFLLRIYHWCKVWGPDGTVWPPVDPPEDTSGESTYITRALPDYLYRAYEVDPNVVVERNTRMDSVAWTSIITPFAGTQPCVAQDVTGTPWVLYTDGTNVKRRNVITGAETTMATGKRPFERWAPGGAYRILTYWRITGAGPNGVVYYRRYDASGAAMDGSEQTLVSDVPEQAVSLDWQANGTITALYSDGTNVVTLTSTDNGATWA